jgi:hypothetical protein
VLRGGHKWQRLAAAPAYLATAGERLSFRLTNVFVQALGDASKVGAKFLIAFPIEVILDPFQFGFGFHSSLLAFVFKAHKFTVSRRHSLKGFGIAANMGPLLSLILSQYRYSSALSFSSLVYSRFFLVGLGGSGSHS